MALSHSASRDELIRIITVHPRVHFPNLLFLTAQAEPGSALLLGTVP